MNRAIGSGKGADKAVGQRAALSEPAAGRLDRIGRTGPFRPLKHDTLRTAIVMIGKNRRANSARPHQGASGADVEEGKLGIEGKL